jgi:hypothetical protein
MLVLLGQIEPQGPLPRKASPVNPDQVMEHPACRGVLDPWAWLVRERGMRRVEGLTPAGRSGRIDEPPDRHHHPHGHDTFGCCERPRGGDTLRVVQPSAPPFGLGRPCVAMEHRLGRPCGRIPCMGGQEATPVRVDQGLTGRAGGRPSPCARVDHLGRWGLRARPPALPIASPGVPGDFREPRGLSATPQGGQGLPRLRCAGQGQTA